MWSLSPKNVIYLLYKHTKFIFFKSLIYFVKIIGSKLIIKKLNNFLKVFEIVKWNRFYTSD